ncbi:MAG TPA: hypothetical protein DIU15_01910 [Deltaproteobacteria bacterium]|nr:hypothetical protein [Deltaproteobacteria bacterium]|tara:strand:- start:452 stop:790 length:339 start_codon:yes stop_codon:yes gene_type:complete
MLASTRLVVTLAFLGLLLSLVGCSTPCDRYCDNTADYIQHCLDNASQGQWEAASWSTWGGYGSADEYAADCKEDFASQVSGSATPDVVESICEDESNNYADLLERGICAELP